MILSTHGIVASQILQVDPDYLAFVNRVTTAGGSLSTTEQSAVLQLVKDLKDYGIWTKMKAIYPMVGASAAACSRNLKSDNFNGTFTATGWTFASTGVTPNGTSAYMDTSLIPLNDITSSSSAHVSFYSRTNQTVTTSCEMGSFDTSAGTRIIMLAIFSNASGVGGYELRHFCINGTFRLTAPSRTDGFALNTKVSSGLAKGFFRNTSLGSLTITDALTNKPIYISARNSNGTADTFSSKECAFASIGDGLTDTEASNFYTAVQAFQTTLSRQV